MTWQPYKYRQGARRHDGLYTKRGSSAHYWRVGQGGEHREQGWDVYYKMTCLGWFPICDLDEVLDKIDAALPNEASTYQHSYRHLPRAHSCACGIRSAFIRDAEDMGRYDVICPCGQHAVSFCNDNHWCFEIVDGQPVAQATARTIDDLMVIQLCRLQGTEYDERLPEQVHWDGQWLDIIHGGINTTYSSYETKKADCHVPTLKDCETTQEAVVACLK